MPKKGRHAGPQQAGAKRSGPSYMQRAVNTLRPRQRFLIVCEGAKTEPRYFERFRVPVVRVDVVPTGANTLSVVKEAIKRFDTEEYDQVWCVFDRDSFTANRFHQALSLAESHGIQVAYSNEAFELWYLLHFDYCHTAIGRADYVATLGKRLGHPYAKNSDRMYDELLSRQETAIKNARRLMRQYKPVKPAADNPSTTVHLLVLQINKYARP